MIPMNRGLGGPAGRILALAGLTLLACDINTEPVAPSWETTVNIPLVSRTRTMEDMIGESGFLISGEAGLLGFQVDGEFDERSVGGDLELGDFNGAFVDSIGDFALADAGPSSVGFRLGTLWPPAEDLHGELSVVPPFAFTDLTAAIPAFGSYESLTLSAGTLRVTITNNTNVPLNLTELRVTDETSGLPVVVFGFPSVIYPGGLASQEIDLAGASLSNQLSVRVSGGSPGSGGAVPIDAEAGLDIAALLYGLRASAATAQIPPTDFSFADNLDLPDDMTITRATLASGLLSIEVDSDLDLATQISFSLPELRDAGGDTLVIVLDVSRKGQTSRQIDLTDYTLTPSPPDPGGGQTIPLRADVTTLDTGSQLVTAQAGDPIELNVRLENLKIFEVEGILSATTFELPQGESDVDLPSGLEGINLERATLDIMLITSIHVPIIVDMEVRGWDGQDGELSLPVNDTLVASGVPGVEDTLRITLTEENSDIIAFLNGLPERIEFSGEVTLGDGVTVGTVRADDYLRGEYLFSTPFRFSIEEQTLTLDPERTDITPNGDEGGEGADQEISADLTDYLLEGAVTTNLINHLPVGMEVMLKLGTDSARVFTDPEVTLGPVYLSSAMVDPSTGLVMTPVATESELALSEDDLGLFKNDGDTVKHVFIGVELLIEGTGGESVSIRGSDFVVINAVATMTVLVDPDDIAGDD